MPDDGTFKYVEKGFCELFVIMAIDIQTKVYLLCGIALLDSIELPLYELLMRELVVHLDFEFIKVRHISTDFKTEPMQEAGIQKHGYYFHFRQAILTKIEPKGTKIKRDKFIR